VSTNLASLDYMANDGTFAFYVLALGVSGILLLIVAALGLGQSVGMRILDAVIGIAFLGYGGYLALIFEGESYRIFFYAFVVPILLLFQIFKGWRAARAS
jgi:phosphate/sulfate permease